MPHHAPVRAPPDRDPRPALLIAGALLGASVGLLGALRQANSVGGFDPGRLGPYLPAWVGFLGLVLAALGIAFALALILAARPRGVE